ncbi:putative zn 2cys6 transcription factor protein [Eutypa lata UCREL1]|uniref:Putative zn 2cys6 transcription factor protein n=1 Tax=Eutypa lata (strain UCR-EL1) TaxID=1287681 RepID=M7T7K8_EUTLA|nr:putative zn 2cys6 transcription factor protein [Eutypa lata UCREL1]
MYARQVSTASVPSSNVSGRAGQIPRVLGAANVELTARLPLITKHSGLEKAVIQIEQALKRSNRTGGDQIQSPEQASELRYLLERSRDLLNAENNSLQRRYSVSNGVNSDQQQVTTSSPHQTIASQETPPSQAGSREGASAQSIEDEHLNLDDAENPLQLLARTSELLSSIEPQQPLAATSSRNSQKPGSGRNNDLQRFFGSFQPRLDVGEDLDPIELGLLTPAEAEALFSYRSAFLFTSIAAASALFSPSLEALYKRLSNHRQKLASLIVANRYKSIEIVLAFMVNVPWISAGEHWADDETSTYISMALMIALDLSLNKIILPYSDEPRTPRDSVATSECVSARKALYVDGFPDVDPNSLIGRRLLRRREHRWDGSIVSVAVLRRDLANLIARVRAICDSYTDGTHSEAGVVDIWYQTWPFQIGDREPSHTRLSMYSSVINHPTAPAAARHYFRAAGLSSALNVLRVAVQGEGQLRSMPNNTAIMISFAACFALRVSTAADGRGSSLAPSIRTLIAETTDVLERIGSTPVQRKGLSVLFASQLRTILKLASRPSETMRNLLEPTREPHSGSSAYTDLAGVTQIAHHHQRSVQQQQMDMSTSQVQPDYLMFSTMSNDQLNEVINNTNVGLDAVWDDFQFQNGTDLDWMDWSTFA